MYQIFYNPIAGNGQGDSNSKQLEQILKGEEMKLHNILFIQNMKSFISEFSADDVIVLLGGDGTLNRFINDVDGMEIKNDILYYAGGSGNDFANDVKSEIDEKGFIKVNKYIANLPKVEVKGKTYRFLNGVGYGIDGYCCEMGDKERGQSSKPVNYTKIAIKGMLFDFKRTNATIIIDGVEKHYEKVWLAPTMNGRLYGGGMMIAPSQDRLNPEKELSLVVFNKASALKTLMIFPSIFEGKHVEHTEYITVMKGHDITVKFDKPTALQIDGETISNVLEYHAYSC